VPAQARVARNTAIRRVVATCCGVFGVIPVPVVTAARGSRYCGSALPTAQLPCHDDAAVYDDKPFIMPTGTTATPHGGGRVGPAGTDARRQRVLASYSVKHGARRGSARRLRAARHKNSARTRETEAAPHDLRARAPGAAVLACPRRTLNDTVTTASLLPWPGGRGPCRPCWRVSRCVVARGGYRYRYR